MQQDNVVVLDTRLQPLPAAVVVAPQVAEMPRNYTKAYGGLQPNYRQPVRP